MPLSELETQADIKKKVTISTERGRLLHNVSHKVHEPLVLLNKVQKPPL